MGFSKWKLMFVTFILLSIHLPLVFAQESTGSQRDHIKKQVQFKQWLGILSTKAEVRYDFFEIDDTMVSPWRIQRVQKLSTANRCIMVQYVLSKSDEPSKAQEITRITVTRCPKRADSAERLIDHLLGLQRPDFRLVDKAAMVIADITVNIPSEPEPAIFFLRGNILIAVENAGKKVTPDIRKLARSLDENLKKKRR